MRNGHAATRPRGRAAGADLGWRGAGAGAGVNDKRYDEATGARRRFASAILPAGAVSPRKITELLPLLYLHGRSSNDFVSALGGLLGTDADLSGATITRLTTQWQDEARAFDQRDLSGVDYVKVWADGIHVDIRLDQEKLCLLVRSSGCARMAPSNWSR